MNKLIKDFKEHSFILLMGADNLSSFHNWYKWEKIFELIPVAIFDRPKYKNISLSNKTAKKFRNYRCSENLSKKIIFLNLLRGFISMENKITLNLVF